MRQIFTSQRLETVEGVARLLEEAGIGVHISQPRSYRGGRRGQFSYSEPVPAKQQPAVWVRKPEDQPRARELLREAGLMTSTRPQANAAALAIEPPLSRFGRSGGRWAWRVRIGLLLLIAAVVAVIWMGRDTRGTAPEAPVASPPPAAPAPAGQDASGDEEIRVRIPPPPPSD
ncbi:hypothetical protein B1992_08645 [Pseudoxanthomonas broegbernensis]|uniref:Pathogenicity-like protein n=1 Tax=Pseudoxanthomonas broegbernensis TaxID=83619 RepID=A0A7V8GM66_9GAMM|nr:hypothetical protein [Pseudoxanthomonas broegbernensis]KAF1686282.1 hypothetical protein B1992_08645 [Pseudoxanthomonas broegbernensis]MBB6063966.1 hypothetical protein [Pseudoxanthomonas broegbernensis]